MGFGSVVGGGGERRGGVGGDGERGRGGGGERGEGGMMVFEKGWNC